MTEKYEADTTISYPCEGAAGRTGGWRDFRPVINQAECIKCLRCWAFCPEGAVTRGESDEVEIDYDYCKGCGVCAFECPKKAITMEREE